MNNGSKGPVIALIIVLSIMAFLIISFMITAIIFKDDTNFFGRNEGEKVVVKEREYEVSDVSNIDVNLTSSDVEFVKSKTDKVKIVQYSKKDLKEKYLFKSNLNNGKLYIEESNSLHGITFFGFIGRSSRYIIYVPTNYKSDINVRSVSSDINLNGNYDFGKASFSSTSGDIKLSGSLKVTDAVIKNVSGDVSVSDVSGKMLKFQTTSGDIEVLTGEGDTNISSISGDVEVSHLRGSLSASTTSGDIELDDFLIMGDSNVKSVSGEVSINFNKSSNCRYKGTSTAGSIKAQNDNYEIGKSPFNNLTVKTTSGDIVFRTK